MKTPSNLRLPDVHVPEIHLPTDVAGKVGGALSTSKDFVQDIAHTMSDRVADRGPDVASAVGRGARSSVDTVGDVVSELPSQVSRLATRLAALTPFVDAAPKRHRSRWLLRVAAVAAVTGLAWWAFTKVRSQPTTANDRSPDRPAGDRSTSSAGSPGRPLASVGT